MGGLDKIRGDKNLILGLSELINIMAELKEMANKYHLQEQLYQPAAGLGKVLEIMGKSRTRKFTKENFNSPMSSQDEWDKITRFLEQELKFIQAYVVRDRSSKPLVSDKTNSDKTNKFVKNALSHET